MTNKFPGRIGDTPTLGDGFWAGSWAEAWDEMVSDSASNGSSQYPTVGGVFREAKDWLADCLP
jgi:L-asparaginase